MSRFSLNFCQWFIGFADSLGSVDTVATDLGIAIHTTAAEVDSASTTAEVDSASTTADTTDTAEVADSYTAVVVPSFVDTTIDTVIATVPSGHFPSLVSSCKFEHCTAIMDFESVVVHTVADPTTDCFHSATLVG